MKGVSLDELNTLAVPSQAREVHTVTSLADLQGLAAHARAEGLVVLGGGSNVILGPRIERPVCLMRIRGMKAVEQGDRALVTAAAGENWHDLVRWSLGHGFAGLENLALIPGSVGAAPVQNIGAYGVELESRFVSLKALEIGTGNTVEMDRADCGFGYRTSLFKKRPGRYVIAEITLSLDAGSSDVEIGYADVANELKSMGITRPAPVNVAEAVIRVRRRKLPDPRFIPNAGSFFKNPTVTGEKFEVIERAHGRLKSYPEGTGFKLAAAELIDRCGFKSDSKGPVGVWRRQPLVLTNPERRPASEVLAYAERIRSTVLATYGVRLELEPDTIEC